MSSIAGVESKIRERINIEVRITFRDFTEMALYHPGMGYYTSDETEIGRGGDYYTSPHLHPLFGAMLGKQMEEMWGLLNKPDIFDVVEVGGGKGHLCKDMLDYLKDKEIFGSLRYTLVELNAYIIDKQKKLLKGYSPLMKWSKSLCEVKAETGCIVTNELFDAMPVHLIEVDGGIKEIYVALKDDKFTEVIGPPSTKEIADYLKEFSVDLPEGYRTEVNLKATDFFTEADEMLKEGFILTIDYGYPSADYYSEERSRGTLLCYHKHNLSENPYENVGRQDITAHVNFSALRKWGEDKGFSPVGFSRQGPYLISLGIAELAAEKMKSSNDPLEMEMIKGLFMPGTMGDTHKVLIQYRGPSLTSPLKGFGISNKVSSL